MNYGNPRLIDELAAQYALGTLRGPARRRFERLCRQDVVVAAAVRQWENRLVALLNEIAPVKPSAAVWRKVQQRLRHQERSERGGLFRWLSQAQWAMAAGVAIAVAAIAWWTLIAVPTQLVATIADQQQSQWWRIDAPADRSELHIAALPALTPDPAHAYELWALSPSGGAPVSLGLMPQTGTGELQLNAAQRVALAAAQQVAISLEPVGGSPTGAPTGPVLFVAEVAKAG